MRPPGSEVPTCPELRSMRCSEIARSDPASASSRVTIMSLSKSVPRCTKPASSTDPRWAGQNPLRHRTALDDQRTVQKKSLKPVPSKWNSTFSSPPGPRRPLRAPDAPWNAAAAPPSGPRLSHSFDSRGSPRTSYASLISLNFSSASDLLGNVRMKLPSQFPEGFLNVLRPAFLVPPGDPCNNL